MPELVHSCGKKLKFPDGSEGKKGKCPGCGQPVEVPRSPGAPLKQSGTALALSTSGSAPALSPAPAAAPVAADAKRVGLAPPPRPRGSDVERVELDPPA